MNSTVYAILGLTAIVAGLIGILVFAVLLAISRLADRKRHEQAY